MSYLTAALSAKLVDIGETSAAARLAGKLGIEM
jgi:hypothetical protein